MPQIFVSPEDLTKNSFVVRGREAHHLIRVLRKKVGDQINIFDGRGSQFTGKLTAIDSKSVLVRGNLMDQLQTSSQSHTLVLFQGIPRGSKFDYVIEKSTELGVNS